MSLPNVSKKRAFSNCDGTRKDAFLFLSHVRSGRVETFVTERRRLCRLFSALKSDASASVSLEFDKGKPFPRVGPDT